MQIPNDTNDNKEENTDSGIDLTTNRRFAFPWKLHQLLQDVTLQGDDDVVAWMPHGRSFIVHDKDAFVGRVLPTYFRQSSYKSFQRQLYIYGFERVSSGTEKGSYFHPKFIRGQRELTFEIHRVPQNLSPSSGRRRKSSTQDSPIGRSPSSSQNNFASSFSNSSFQQVLNQRSSSCGESQLVNAPSIASNQQQDMQQLQAQSHQWLLNQSLSLNSFGIPAMPSSVSSISNVQLLSEQRAVVETKNQPSDSQQSSKLEDVLLTSNRLEKQNGPSIFSQNINFGGTKTCVHDIEGPSKHLVSQSSRQQNLGNPKSFQHQTYEQVLKDIASSEPTNIYQAAQTVDTRRRIQDPSVLNQEFQAMQPELTESNSADICTNNNTLIAQSTVDIDERKNQKLASIDHSNDPETKKLLYQLNILQQQQKHHELQQQQLRQQQQQFLSNHPIQQSDQTEQSQPDGANRVTTDDEKKDWFSAFEHHFK